MGGGQQKVGEPDWVTDTHSMGETETEIKPRGDEEKGRNLLQSAISPCHKMQIKFEDYRQHTDHTAAGDLIHE